ncbi:MAG: hypothetical protein WAN76_27490 [Candidatus Sulfotelmatobacter sp.]
MVTDDTPVCLARKSAGATEARLGYEEKLLYGKNLYGRLSELLADPDVDPMRTK